MSHIRHFSSVLQEAFGAGTARPGATGGAVSAPPGPPPEAPLEKSELVWPLSDGASHPDKEPATASDESPALLALADPMARSLALPGFQATLAESQPHVASSDPWPPGLEGLLERMVRRAQWGGDGRRGTARIELGSGTLAGGVLLVTLEQGALSVDLELPPGAAPNQIGDRLRERLEAKGLVLSSFTVS